MHALTNSGAVLLAVLLFFLLIFLAVLSYLFCRCIGSFPDPSSPASKEMEEDVVPMAAEAELDVSVADKWRVSRLLFTIEEECLEMEDDEEDVDNESELQVEIPVEYSGEPTPFFTPSDSPPYFTPSASPGRDIYDVTDVYEISRRSCCLK